LHYYFSGSKDSEDITAVDQLLVSLGLCAQSVRGNSHPLSTSPRQTD